MLNRYVLWEQLGLIAVLVTPTEMVNHSAGQQQIKLLLWTKHTLPHCDRTVYWTVPYWLHSSTHRRQLGVFGSAGCADLSSHGSMLQNELQGLVLQICDLTLSTRRTKWWPTSWLPLDSLASSESTMTRRLLTADMLDFLSSSVQPSTASNEWSVSRFSHYSYIVTFVSRSCQFPLSIFHLLPGCWIILLFPLKGERLHPACTRLLASSTAFSAYICIYSLPTTVVCAAGWILVSR